MEIKWRGKQVSGEVKIAAVEGLKNAAEYILDESNKKVPIDEGTLMNSGKTSVDSDKLEAAISYDTPYATRVHEDMQLRHKNGREAKFLESAIKENRDKVRDYIADSIRAALRK